MANMKRIGYGQVEPNHLSAQRTAQIYAQLPADASYDHLENGQFVKYDYAEGKVNKAAGAGEYMMVFNEVKLYDGYRETYKDYAMKKADFVDGVMVPRVIKTNIGDIYTTNCLKEASKGAKETTAMEDLKAGDLLKVNAEGFLEKDGGPISGIAAPVFEVAKRYTLADGQDAVKVMRVK